MNPSTTTTAAMLGTGIIGGGAVKGLQDVLDWILNGICHLGAPASVEVSLAGVLICGATAYFHSAIHAQIQADILKRLSTEPSQLSPAILGEVRAAAMPAPAGGQAGGVSVRHALGFAAVGLALLLGACQTPPAGGPAPAPVVTPAGTVDANGGKVDTAVANANTALSNITAADLDLAIKLATRDDPARNDKAAIQCYTYLRGNLGTLPGGTGLVVPKGIFSSFQIARNGIQKVKGGVSSELNLNCAALFMSAQGDVLSIANLVAKIAATVGSGGIALPSLIAP